MAQRVATATRLQLFYIFDVEAFFLKGRDYKTLVHGDAETVFRMAAEDGGRYEVCASLREYNDTVKYYKSII